MKAPLPLRDPRSQASSELRALLAAVEPPPALPAAVRERVRRSLGRRVATERRAVCWSHALGCALALVTCLAWWLPQRAPEPDRSSMRRTAVPAARIAAAASATPIERAAPEPVVVAPRRADASAAVVIAEAGQESAAKPAVRKKAKRAATARRAVPAERLALGPARSRKRIEALVDDILKPDAQLLDRARQEAERDPEQALALIDSYRRSHPGSPIPAPAAVAEVDALRRLGRFEDAIARARALLESSSKPYYADVMAERFALLEL